MKTEDLIGLLNKDGQNKADFYNCSNERFYAIDKAVKDEANIVIDELDKAFAEAQEKETDQPFKMDGRRFINAALAVAETPNEVLMAIEIAAGRLEQFNEAVKQQQQQDPMEMLMQALQATAPAAED